MKKHLCILSLIAALSSAAQTADHDLVRMRRMYPERFTNETLRLEAAQSAIRVLAMPTEQGGYGITDMQAVLDSESFNAFIATNTAAQISLQEMDLAKIAQFVAVWRDPNNPTQTAQAIPEVEREKLLVLLETPVARGGYGIPDIRTVITEPAFRPFVDSSAWASNIFYNDQFQFFPQVVSAYRKTRQQTAASPHQAGAMIDDQITRNILKFRKEEEARVIKLSEDARSKDMEGQISTMPQRYRLQLQALLATQKKTATPYQPSAPIRTTVNNPPAYYDSGGGWTARQQQMDIGYEIDAADRTRRQAEYERAQIQRNQRQLKSDIDQLRQELNK